MPSFRASRSTLAGFFGMKQACPILAEYLETKPTSLAATKERRALPEYPSDVHPDPAYGLGLMLTANESDAHPLGHGGAGSGSKIAVFARAQRLDVLGL